MQEKVSLALLMPSTEWGRGIHLWNKWASFRESGGGSGHVPVTTPVLEMPVTDLSYWMGNFVLKVRKKDGKEYPPKSLYAIVCCFKRFVVFFFEQNDVHFNLSTLCLIPFFWKHSHDAGRDAALAWMWYWSKFEKSRAKHP